MSEKQKDGPDTEAGEKERPAEVILPPLDVSSLFLPFYTQAMLKLGMLPDPDTQKEEVNLDLAKRMIDLLDLFKEKTQGHLSPEEDSALSGILQQLKLTYMEKARIIKL